MIPRSGGRQTPRIPPQRSQEPICGPNSAQTSPRHPALRNVPQSPTGVTAYDQEALDYIRLCQNSPYDVEERMAGIRAAVIGVAAFWAGVGGLWWWLA